MQVTNLYLMIFLQKGFFVKVSQTVRRPGV